jgi:hypothetical protein
VGPYAPQSNLPPPPPVSLLPAKPGMSLGTFLGILLGLAVVLLSAALAVMSALYVRERNLVSRREAELSEARQAAASSAGGSEASSRSDPHPELPSVTRHVPRHALRVLEGCSNANLATVADVLGDAIEEGAPLYNDGDFAGCYQAYLVASLKLEHRLPTACAGPSHALADGRTKADGLDPVSAKAWAMRDAFDGLLEVIARSQGGGGTNL